MANANANANASASSNSNGNGATAGSNLLAGGDFEVSWVIRGTEWSSGSVPTGWQAISNPIASGSGLSGQEAQELVAIERQIQTQSSQTYVLKLELQQKLAANSVLEVAWGGETVATLRGADLKPPQSIQLLLPGSDGSRALRLITNKRVDFGKVAGLGLFAESIQKPSAVELPGSATEGQALKANTSQLRDPDGLGTLAYQWQSKSQDGKGWQNITGADQSELALDAALVGSELRLSVSYIDGGGTTEVVVSKPTVAVTASNRPPDAGGVKQLAEINEDESFVLSRADLLRGASDANRDALGVLNVQLDQGSGTVSPIDADNWRFSPTSNWSGNVRLRYEITDGKARTPAAAQFTVVAVNDAPTLSGTQATLANGTEDIVLTLKESDLLSGFSDADADALSVSGLITSSGTLNGLGNGNWSLTPFKDVNGTVELTYFVIDGQGGTAAASQSFSLAPVNDAPVTQTLRIDVETDDPTTVHLTQEQLLMGSSDPDGDALHIKNLFLISGKASIEDNRDGSWTLTTERHSNGDSVLHIDVSDGSLNSQAQIIVNVIRKPVFSTFTVLDMAIRGDEGGNAQIRVQRDGDRSTEQTVHFRLEGSGLNTQDLGIGTAFFASGSEEAVVDVVFEKDGRWEGLETGRLVADTIDSPNNVQCSWSNSSIDVCIRDLDARHDGTGNNRSGSSVGSSGSLELRVAGADYSDGHDNPAGQERPGARAISNAVMEQTITTRNARDLSDFVWAWGQFIDHDIVATAGGSESFSIALPENDKLVQMNLPECEPVGDEFTGIQYDSQGRIIQNPIRQTPSNNLVFTRSLGINDASGVRQQLNNTTAFLDGSVVYGSDETRAQQLRSFTDGKLKIESNGLLTTELQTEGIGFAAGDSRATENPLLSSLQTLWVREHNRIADELTRANPALNDEQIYQKARTKVMGLLQHITYDEFLPALLGDNAISNYKGYDENTNPGILNEFAAAAYRFGHSMISETLATREQDGSASTGGDIPLKDAFFNIQFLQQSGIDTVLRGASLQQAQEIDSQYTDSLRNFLFSTPPEGSKCPMRGILRFANGAFPALDLASRNLQRGRDHGLEDYNSVREAMGLRRVTSFDDITSNEEVAQHLKELYKDDINNIDLYVAGLAEDHLEGGSLGELFSAIIVRQFEAIRNGDRFWYENQSNNLFTAEEIAEIKATRLSDVIERNTGISDLHDNVFLVSIKGTSGNDVLNGSHLADKFCASLGHDRISGGDDIDTVDYTTINSTVTLRFDGVLKGSNSLDQAGVDAWASLQDLANQGNGTAAEIFKLHQGFFGQSISGFFNDLEAAQERLPAGGPTDDHVPAGLGFDQLNSIEVIKAHQGSSIDGRGATDKVEVDLAAGLFSTNLFQHPIRTLVEGFTHVFGSRKGDTLKGDSQDNMLLGMGDNDRLEGRGGNDQLVGGSGDDQIDGGQGVDTAYYSSQLSDYTVWAEDNVLHVQDKRPGTTRDGSDQLKDVEWLQFADQAVATRPYLNKAPTLSSEQAVLAEGAEDTPYSITAADLLKGFTDPNGDPLFITDLQANQGELTATGEGIWTLIPPKDFNGTIELSYSVADDLSAKTTAKQSVKLVAVNDTPVVSGEVNLGSMNEDGSFRIWSDTLLATASDVENDVLTVVDLKLTEGQGVITENGDGSWNFAPSRDWSGPVSFSYGVTDGQSANTKAELNHLAIRGNSLYLLTENGTWTETETRAIQLGGHLATINDAEENQFLWDQFSNNTTAAWIGYNQESGRYSWSSGEASTYTNWHPGCPDFSYELYAHIALYQDPKGLGLWGDSDNLGAGNLGLGKGIAEIPILRYGDSAYVIVNGSTWNEAESNAIKLGGHLVTINSEDENRFLTQLGAGRTDNYYIGLTDQAREGNWIWASGEASTYRNWAREGVDWQITAPNGGSAENYAVIMGSNNIFQDGHWISNPNPTWHDWNNSALKGIAEIKLGPDFSVAAGSAQLTVNPANNATSGNLGIDVIGTANDVFSSDPTTLSWSDVQEAGIAVGIESTNPVRPEFTGDLLSGSTGSDSMIGTSGNDVLMGALRGANAEQVDALTGGSGADLFILGDSQSSFYSGQNFKDFAHITDFDPTKDQLQLFSGDLYLAAGINRQDVMGTGIFKDADRNGILSNGDDLIAIVSNQNNPIELGRENFRTA